MGFIQAFKGALSQTFADQWKDFYLPQSNVPATAAVFRAVPKGTNNGVGENTKGAENIITNGSKIVVPEGTALVTLQDGAITGFITEPGGYEFKSDDPNSKSLFAGDGILAPTIKESWERFKFGGQPGSQQLAFYVNLKEIPGLRFGTQTPVPYDDAFLATQVSVVARGTYSLKISDPIVFLKQFVPQKYLQSNASVFDFADPDNEAGEQLFTELVAVLGGAFTAYSNNPERGGRLAGIATDANSYFKDVLGEQLEETYQWKESRGLEVSKVAIIVEYDEETKELLKEVQKDDKAIRMEKRKLEVETERGKMYSENMQGMMAGAVGHSMQTQAEGWKAAGEGMKAAGESGSLESVGSGMLMGMGMQGQMQGADALNAVNNMQSNSPKEDPTEKLLNAKKLLDAGAITQEDYDKVKAQVLGL